MQQLYIWHISEFKINNVRYDIKIVIAVHVYCCFPEACAANALMYEGFASFPMTLKWLFAKSNSCGCQGLTGEMKAGTQTQENVSFNNKIKQRAAKTTPKGEKQTGRQAGRELLHSQHNTHMTKDNGSAQDYRHQEAKYGDKRG